MSRRDLYVIVPLRVAGCLAVGAALTILPALALLWCAAWLSRVLS